MDIIGQITKIMAQKRPGRFNVFIDNQYAFPVSENVLIKYQLLKGMEVSAELANQLKSADQIDRYYQTAINYLAHRLRTTTEISDRLGKDEASETAIAQVMQRLIENHLVDDQSYANSYVRSEVRMHNKGPAQLKQYLIRKGITEKQIDQALSEYYPDQTILENGIHQAQKLFQHYSSTSYQNGLQKVRTALVRKGYPFEIITSIMDEAEFPYNEDQEDQLLDREFQKIWKRNRHYEEFERKQKTKQTLYRKGFAIDAINRLIDEANES